MTHNHGVVGSSPTGSTIVVNNLNNNFNTFTTMTFLFTSTRKSDKVTQIMIMSKDVVAAHIVANRYFKNAGYKGQPKMLAV